MSYGGSASFVGLICSLPLLLQASILVYLFLDRFPFFKNVLGAVKVDVRGSDVVQAIVIALIVLVIDKDTDLLLQIAWQLVVFQENGVLGGLMPAFDFPLFFGMEWSTKI